MSSSNKSPTPEMPREVELLLCCARTEVDAARAARINVLLGQPLNWDYLVDMAQRHALVPLLYRQLNRVGSKVVPASHLSRLLDEFASNAARNLLLTRELVRILDLLEEHGLQVVPYKGPALAVTAYGDATMRQYSDLDLLVHERDAQRAAQLLLTLGYRSHYQTGRRPLAHYIEMLCEQGFVRDDGSVYVEIHWAIAPHYISPLLETEVFWSRLVKINIGGRSALALSTEDLLLALCIHAGKHQWERLAWVCDLNETILRHPSIEWERLIAESARTKTRRMLFLGLYLANELLGTTLPLEVLKQVRTEPSVKDLADHVRRRFFMHSYRPYSPAEAMRFHFRMRERAVDGARCCYYMMIPPTPSDLAAINLPNALSFLYYPLRPLRLIKKYAQAQLRRIN